MSPRTEQQFEEIRENRKLQIMQTALELFAREGYQGSSVARIAKDAGISKGLLYNYFTSKEDLLSSIMKLGFEKSRLITEEIRKKSGIPEGLLLTIHCGFELIRRETDFYRLLFTVFMQPGVIDGSHTEFQEGIEQMLGEVALYYVAKGDPDPNEKARLLMNIMDGVGFNFFMSPETVNLDKMEKIIFELFK
jgi:AcrR family transcriptional regulator